MINPSVIERGAHWIAVHKPAGMSVHNDAGADLLSWLRESHPADWHLVHRLDRETSGVVLACSNSALLTELQRQWSSFKKTYWMLVRGQLTEPSRWKQPLTDRSEGRRSPAGARQHRVVAETVLRSICVGTHCSLLEAQLVTGRQHQIRKHAVLNGHEILLDRRYGQPKFVQRLARRFPAESLCLHATSLEVEIRGQSRHWCCPPPVSWDNFGVPVAELWLQN